LFVILSMEKITIKDIKLIGFHGLYDYEKENGVNLSIDVQLFFKNKINNNNDDINSTVNYVDIIDLVSKVNSSENFNLLETLCNKILKEIMHIYSPLKAIIKIKKFDLPIETTINFVEIEMSAEENA
jgi:7,8-dihydroneopterin aldolase/epimerase/oxygenase